MTNVSKLIEYLDKDPNIERLRSLEKYFDSNSEVKKLIEEKQNISKELVNSRYIKLTNNSKKLKEEYDLINEKIKNYPFLDEYLDLLDYYHNEYVDIIKYLEDKINSKL